MEVTACICHVASSSWVTASVAKVLVVVVAVVVAAVVVAVADDFDGKAALDPRTPVEGVLTIRLLETTLLEVTALASFFRAVLAASVPSAVVLAWL